MTIVPGLSISDIEEVGEWTYNWPNGDERFSRGWKGSARLGEKVIAVRHMVSERTNFGGKRSRTTTFFDGYPVVEGCAADDYEQSRALVSLIYRTRKDRTNIKDREKVPELYEQFDVVWYRKEIKAKGSYYAFAVKIKEDDLERWVVHGMERRGLLAADEDVAEVDLRDPKTLRRIFEEEFIACAPAKEWKSRYAEMLEKARTASSDQFHDPAYQGQFWDGNPVAGLGPGEFPYLADKPGFAEFSSFAAEIRDRTLPEDPAARQKALEGAVRELFAQAAQCFPKRRKPHGKIFRFMATLYPRDFCSVAARGILRQIAETMVGKEIPKHPVYRHAAIMWALEKALGPCEEAPHDLAVRGTFPWWLYENYMLDGAGGEIDGDDDDGEVDIADWAAPSFEDIEAQFRDLPFVFSRSLIARFHTALHAHARKHFVLLSGLSGTGKTQLARIYANLYCNLAFDVPNPNLCLVPVQPDWTDPSGLLGYVNPLREKVTYERTECLTFLHRARKQEDQPFFLILDEMNLARPEYYFAPFLSAMETGDPLIVHSQGGPIDLIEPTLAWPSNLYVIGTVNMDETTHSFSDKVLDRAFTIELWDVDLEELRSKLENYPAQLLDFVFPIFERVQGILKPLRMHVGYRVLREIVQYLSENERGGKALVPRPEAMDACLYMKVLPRLRGEDSGALRGALKDFRELCAEREFPESAEKLSQMEDELTSTGITKFWR